MSQDAMVIVKRKVRGQNSQLIGGNIGEKRESRNPFALGLHKTLIYEGLDFVNNKTRESLKTLVTTGTLKNRKVWIR